MVAVVPLKAVPNQRTRMLLSNQDTTLVLWQKTTGLFADVYVNDAPVVLGVICLDRTLIIRSAYLGYQGDFVFWDTQGTDDPVYTGIGSRFQLLFYAAGELVLASSGWTIL